MVEGRVYTVSIVAVASPAAIFDMFELVPATNKPLVLLRLKIAQSSEPTTEEENIGISIVIGHTTSGSGGSAPTPSKVNRNDSAAGFTAETMNTTIASAGTTETPFADTWNTRSGTDIPLSPQEALTIVNGERVVIRSAAPADAVTIHATLWVMEQG